MQRFGFLLILLLATQWRRVSSSFGSNGESSSSLAKSVESFFGKAASKSAQWLTVDPSQLLTTLSDRGGLFIPEDIDGDLRILKRAVHCQESQLDIIHRTLAVTNFTIGLKGKPALLRVGKMFFHWDSWTDPVLHIEVDEVSLDVEFTNLLLTKTNWGQLTAIGFPPTFETSQAPPNDKDDNAEKVKENDYSWLRFDAINVKGDVSVRISSKPLDRDLGVMKLDMGNSALKVISEELNKKSNLNYQSSGRRGLNIQELGDLLAGLVLQKARTYVMEHAQDIINAKDNLSKEALRDSVDKIVESASNAIADYAFEATETSANNMMKNLKESKWGNRLQNLFQAANKTLTELTKDDAGDKTGDDAAANK